jgi:hypothetical protein
MRKRIRGRLTYANVIATLALFLVLGGGTAAALDGSNTVFSDDIVNDQVFPADVRNDTLTGGGLTAADLRPASVGTSEVTDDALTGSDVNESTLGLVPNASHATNSDQLGGRAAAGYQRRVGGACSGGGAIQSIRGDGGVSCTSRVQEVFPISADLSAPGQAFIELGPSNLFLDPFCTDTQASVRFNNIGPGGATLNWLFSSESATSVHASGTSLGASGLISFVFVNRLEGQWIFADSEGVTTVNLHGFYEPGSPALCEFKGTAEFAPLG